MSIVVILLIVAAFVAFFVLRKPSQGSRASTGSDAPPRGQAVEPGAKSAPPSRPAPKGQTLEEQAVSLAHA